MAIYNDCRDATRLERRRNFVEAKASVRLEGGSPSPELEALGQLYIEGAIGIDEFVDKGLKLHHRTQVSPLSETDLSEAPQF